MEQSGAKCQNKYNGDAWCLEIVKYGKCQNPENCDFAHNKSEIIKCNGNYKSTVCPEWKCDSDSCSQGAFCMRAHGIYDVMRVHKRSEKQPKKNWCPDLINGYRCVDTKICSFAHSSEDLKKHAPFYKRGLCDEWKDNGTCQSGEFCLFAHGEDDKLKGDMKHVQAATEKRKKPQQRRPNVVQEGSCEHESFGYAHSQEELSLNPPGKSNVARWSQKDIWCPDLKRLGSCGRQETCRYFHSRQELVEKFAGYKRQLCMQFNTNGTCPRGEFCLFAHGQNDILFGNLSRGSVRAPTEKELKRQWCLNVIQEGVCGLKESCGYAHTQEELRANFPLYKFQLCSLFDETGSCSKGEFCLYAHGPNELLARRSANRTKTKWCPNVVREGSCSQMESCDYAHSQDELKATQLYKSQLCKQFVTMGTCSEGNFCLYAHGSQELKSSRPGNQKCRWCPNLVQEGACAQMESCCYAHSEAELQSNSVLYKSVLCSIFDETGACEKGKFCLSAHGRHELRQSPPMNQSGNNNSKSSLNPPGKSDVANDAHSSISHLKHKWCPNVVEKGFCAQIHSCGFSHSQDELRKTTPRYKTALCDHFEKNGTCPKGKFCLRAHGQVELTESQPENQSKGKKKVFSERARLKHKWCPNVVEKGSCAQIDSCDFSHSQDDLRKTSVYKTSLCDIFEVNGTCTYGEFCIYAHGRDELTGSQSENQSECKKGDLSESTKVRLKRKWCPNMVKKSSCRQRETCHYAHSQEELRANASLYKSAICPYFAEKGTCTKGKFCFFAHGSHELTQEKAGTTSTMSIPTLVSNSFPVSGGGGAGLVQGHPPSNNPPNWPMGSFSPYPSTNGATPLPYPAMVPPAMAQGYMMNQPTWSGPPPPTWEIPMNPPTGPPPSAPVTGMTGDWKNDVMSSHNVMRDVDRTDITAKADNVMPVGNTAGDTPANAQWFITAMNRDVSTGPRACPFPGSFAPLSHSLVPHCPLRLRAPLCSFIFSLVHSLPSLWESV